ncbi:hypothetical protein B0T25DRAFT_517908 [Lasiosphaeria hispida]|uniref:Saccharopine dehydrogenase-like C-terminal domain-containing protein n=1 Tax=Lasiosphaeria hispida TaxID=260671 RepID=A0AAJ0HHD5_9PEZI|nr:hypothetical protein B0T25DRAFT_517908 [Lasiosphaeria hispida]
MGAGFTKYNPRYSFLIYPNRDSTPFPKFYNIPKAHTIMHRSLQYKANPALVKALIRLRWLDSSKKPWLIDGITWAQIQHLLFGDPNGYSSMSKAVGITYGIATQVLLDSFKPLNQPGVLAPYTKEIYDPLRAKVKAKGIKLAEEVVKKTP